MEFMELIQQRHSIRKYQDADIPDEDLKKILEAARLAPSGKNIQNWHFVVIKNQELKEKIQRAIVEKNEEIAAKMDEKDPEKGKRFRKFPKSFTLFYMNAPVLILVYTTMEYPTGYQEMQLIDADESELNDLLARSNGLINVGAAMENMELRMTELGYGCCWMTGQTYASQEIEALVKEATGYGEEGWYLSCMMSVGIPQPDPKSPGRKPLEEICTFAY